MALCAASRSKRICAESTYSDEDAQVTQRFREIVAHDYPCYTFVEP